MLTLKIVFGLIFYLTMGAGVFRFWAWRCPPRMFPADRNHYGEPKVGTEKWMMYGWNDDVKTTKFQYPCYDVKEAALISLVLWPFITFAGTIKYLAFSVAAAASGLAWLVIPAPPKPIPVKDEYDQLAEREVNKITGEAA